MSSWPPLFVIANAVPAVPAFIVPPAVTTLCCSPDATVNVPVQFSVPPEIVKAACCALFAALIGRPSLQLRVPALNDTAGAVDDADTFPVMDMVAAPVPWSSARPAVVVVEQSPVIAQDELVVVDMITRPLEVCSSAVPPEFVTINVPLLEASSVYPEEEHFMAVVPAPPVFCTVIVWLAPTVNMPDVDVLEYSTLPLMVREHVPVPQVSIVPA